MQHNPINDLPMPQLCDIVRQTSYDIHVYLGHGLFEKVYENALTHRLRKLGVEVIQQHPIHVYDEDGEPIGEYIADLLVANRLLVELKTVRVLNPNHESQIMGYLRATRVEHGMLINFGSACFQMDKFVL